MVKPVEAWLRTGLSRFLANPPNKIITRYDLLVLILVACWSFITTQLTTGFFETRFKDKIMLDAARQVSNQVTNQEQIRLEIARAAANTAGLPEALAGADFQKLPELISPLMLTHQNIDSLMLVDAQGRPGLYVQRQAVDSSPLIPIEIEPHLGVLTWPAVFRVLSAAEDQPEATQLVQEPVLNEWVIYTIGPVRTQEGIVGAALVGTFLKKEITALHSLTLTELTLLNEPGQVLASTLAQNEAEVAQILGVLTPERYQAVIAQENVLLPARLAGSPETENGDIEVQGQTYRLAYIPFMLRGQAYGVYTAALPMNFIAATYARDKNILSLVFTIGVTTFFGIGYLVSRRIRPLLKTQAEETSELNTVLNSIADGVIVRDLAGNIKTMNLSAQKILNSVTSNLASSSKDDATRQARAQARLSSLLTYLAGLPFYTTQDIEIGGLVLSTRAAPVATLDGEQFGAVFVLRDITPEVEAHKLKDDFIMSISHELRTPLAAIKGYNDLLKVTARGTLNEQQGVFIEGIEQNTVNLQDLIQKMLDLSQISAGALGIDREPVDLSELIKTEAQKWADEMAAKGLSYEVHTPAEPVWVEGDQERLSEVVHNLVKNAYQYTLAPGSVAISMKQVNGQVQVAVRDTGVGIPRKDQPFLFSRFFRATREEDNFEIGGAGLGLFISKAILEAHGGQIWFESEIHQGSTFSFALPTIIPQSENTEDSSSEA